MEQDTLQDESFSQVSSPENQRAPKVLESLPSLNEAPVFRNALELFLLSHGFRYGLLSQIETPNQDSASYEAEFFGHFCHCLGPSFIKEIHDRLQALERGEKKISIVVQTILANFMVAGMEVFVLQKSVGTLPPLVILLIISMLVGNLSRIWIHKPENKEQNKQERKFEGTIFLLTPDQEKDSKIKLAADFYQVAFELFKREKLAALALPHEKPKLTPLIKTFMAENKQLRERLSHCLKLMGKNLHDNSAKKEEAALIKETMENAKIAEEARAEIEALFDEEFPTEPVVELRRAA
jgi:hypothetical protein